MKKLMLILAVMLSQLGSFAQTAQQQRNLTNFFLGKGKDVIAGWAHPAHNYYPARTEVSVTGYCTTVKIYFEGDFINYSSTYRVCYNTQSRKFSSLSVEYEGNRLMGSFVTCSAASSVQGCINACKSALDFHWILEGYSRSF